MKSIPVPSLAMLRAIGILTAMIVLTLVLNAAQCLAQAVVGESPKSAKSDSAKKEKLEFMRVRKERGKPVAMETAIAKYVATEGPYAGAEVDLIGAVHIAEQSYFDELNVRFKDYEAVLYELVANPEDRPKPTDEPRRSAHPVGMLQLGMKDMLDLTFQLDKIDYEAKNFVHADMNPEEMSASMAERGDGFMALLFRSMGAGMAMQGAGKSSDADLLAALFSRDRPKALRRAFAQQFEMMELQMAGLAGEDGKSTLITERNAKAMDVLKRELAAGKKKISIFYGAGHLSDMHTRLIEDFKMKSEGTQWLEAWDLR